VSFFLLFYVVFFPVLLSPFLLPIFKNLSISDISYISLSPQILYQYLLIIYHTSANHLLNCLSSVINHLLLICYPLIYHLSIVYLLSIIYISNFIYYLSAIYHLCIYHLSFTYHLLICLCMYASISLG
jgi:hypothetical protein